MQQRRHKAMVISTIRYRLFTIQFVILAFLLPGCTSIYYPTNEAITQVDETTGYRRLRREVSKEANDTLLLLSFSGGGTCAAALSYGVMQELRDTIIVRDGQEIRLLEEIDTISAVSGGSFTAAYYGAYRDQLFENFEEQFLRRKVQSALTRQLFNPINWWKGASKGLDRTELSQPPQRCP
jgi:NTE family protein